MSTALLSLSSAVSVITQAGGSGGSTPPPPLAHPSVEYSALLPELIMIGGALLIVLISSMLPRRRRPGLWSGMTIAAGVASALSAVWMWNHFNLPEQARTAAVNAIAVDGFSVFLILAIASAVVIGALVADSYLPREGLDGPEFYVLAMLSASGGMLMAAANDLLVLFLGLEVLSIALYVLAAFHRRRAESGEAGMKYFILGGFASALFLYGVALVYGGTGSTNMQEIASFLADNFVRNQALLLGGMTLLIVGLGFKVAAVPFHAWTPDVYQGSPTPATGFMAAAAKAAGFAGLLRLFFSTFPDLRFDWQPIIWVLAALTVLTGSILALVQTDIKRMLAYSSISHAGYVLIGLQAGTAKGLAGSLYYLLAYTFMVLGSFAVVTVVGRKGDNDHNLEAYRGLSTRKPALAMAFTVLLLAQAGVPFTTGLWAKFYVISAAVQRGGSSYALALIGMLAAAISAFFYLRVTVLMYMGDETTEGTEGGGGTATAVRLRVPAGIVVALVLTLAFTIVFGLVPNPVIHFATQATPLF